MEVVTTAKKREVSPSRSLELAALYETAFPASARFVKQMGGNLDDARDVFQDALLIYYEKAAEKKTDIRVSEEAYLLGIARHLWFRKHGRSRQEVTMSDWEQALDIPAADDPTPAEHRLLTLLETAGKKCLDLLKSFYYDKLNVARIAAGFGYASERSATVQKYKCLEKVRNEVKQKALQYEDLLD